MNSVNIIGNIGHDLEIRYTGSGKAVLNFNIAVNDFNGETEWFRVVLWNKQAENTAKYCRKGSKVGVSGRLSINKYTNKDNVEIEQVEIVGLGIDFLSHTDEAAKTGNQSVQKNNEPINTWENKAKDENPFNNIDFDKENPFEGNDDVTEISDDDLPF